MQEGKLMAVNLSNENFISMFREYDIRGRVSEDELNSESVYQIVAAYAQFLKRRSISKAVVGYDNRDCSPEFAESTNRALSDNGIDVFFVGLAISPYVYSAQYILECEGAVMITASHNPNGWSGFKFAKGYSKTLEADDIKELFELVNQNNQPDADGQRGVITNSDVREKYIDSIVSRIHMGKYKPKVVIDAGNGGAGLFAYEVFHRMGCLTFQLNCDPDTTYPHYFPNPSDIKARAALRTLVTHPYIQADVGIGYDGDGDRIGVIDESGDDIYSDIVLAILAKQLLEKKNGAMIVFDVKCSLALEEVIKAHGGIPLMWKTGHSYIKAKMHEVGAALAGERSGHIFIGGDDYFGFDDAVFASAKLVEYLSQTQSSVSEIVGAFPQYVTSPEIKANCEDTKKYQVIESIVDDFKTLYPNRVNDINGARVSFESGWGLVRASSNLPEIVLIFEADSEENLRKIRGIFKEVLSKYPEISSKWENDPY
jgi:phosphomannomutase/phosphoglucomutase